MKGNIKKKGLIFGILFSLFLFSNFALATEPIQFSLDAPQYGTEANFFNTIKTFVGNAFSFLVLEPGLDNEAAFAKSLLFILLYVILFAISSKIPLTRDGPAWIKFVLAFAVAILATRTISADMIAGILLPYTAMGISMSVIIPFILMFYFLHEMVTSRIIRKFGWIFFAIVMFGLWMSRSSEIGTMNHMYLWFTIISLVLLTLDGTIHKFWMSMKHGKEKSSQASASVQILLGKRADLLNRISSAPAGKVAIIKGQITKVEKQIKALEDYA